MSKCKSCGAEIIWIKTPAGKNTPIDAEPAGLFWVHLKSGWVTYKGFVSHFATCPNAAGHRGTAVGS